MYKQLAAQHVHEKSNKQAEFRRKSWPGKTLDAVTVQLFPVGGLK